MEEFKAIHGELYKLQDFCGLWPIPDPQKVFLYRVKRVVINTATILCIACQYSTLRNVECTLNNVLSTVSFSGPMVLYFARYISYLLASKTMCRIYREMTDDFVKWKNTDEMKLFLEEVDQAKLLYYYYIRVVIFTVVGLYLAFIPIITQTKHQVAYLRYFGFYFTQQSIQTTLVCFHIMFVYGVGIFCILGTEAAVSAICHHVCGLLKVTCYNLQKTINDCSRSYTPLKVDVGPALESHYKAISIVELISRDLGLSYMVTIGTAIVSFALNLCRIFLVITQGKFDEAVAPFLIILAHVVMMFLPNHAGQRVSSTSHEILNAVYTSEWYNIPLHERKLVNFIMLRTSKDIVVNLLSLYTANYEGYAMMMKTAFSYFTVLLSIQ